MNKTIQSIFQLNYQLQLNNLLPEESPIFFITNPHSECKNKKENLCDQVSSKRRKQILLDSEINMIHPTVNLFFSKKRPIIGIVPKIHRSLIDLNRNISMNTFHFFLFKFILRKYPKIILLDIHSYPDGYHFTGNSNKEMDLVILYANETFLPILESLQNYLERKNFSIALIPGGENLLINYAVKQGHFGILLEFPDKGDDERASILIQYILYFLQNNRFQL